MPPYSFRKAVALAAAGLAITAGSAAAAPADLDRGFGDNGVAQVRAPDAQTARSLTAQPDGKLLITGVTGNNALVGRLNADGSLDRGFGTDGLQPIDSGGSEIANAAFAQADGRIVVVGETSVGDNAAVYRLLPGGGYDNSLDKDGAIGIDAGSYEAATDVVVGPRGEILIVGAAGKPGNRDILVHRMLGDGEPDRRLGSTGTKVIETGRNEGAQAVAVQPDGKIVVAGSEDGNVVVYRLSEEGTPDSSFDGDGRRVIDLGASDQATDVTLQPDGGIVVAAETEAAQSSDGVVMRLKTDGSDDPTFKAAPINTAAFDSVASAAVQPDGKIVVGGTAGGSGGFAVRMNRDGSPDASFGRAGVATFGNTALAAARGMVLQPDGRIVLAGDNAATDRDLVALRLQGVDAGGDGGGGAGPQAGDGGNDPRPRPQVRVRCNGRVATIVGTNGRDRIKGTRGRDVIAARGGADKVAGLRSNDIVCGGAGNDVIRGGAGKDRLFGQAGRDKLFGGAGKDRLSGGAGRDITRQ